MHYGAHAVGRSSTLGGRVVGGYAYGVSAFTWRSLNKGDGTWFVLWNKLRKIW